MPPSNNLCVKNNVLKSEHDEKSFLKIRKIKKRKAAAVTVVYFLKHGQLHFTLRTQPSTNYIQYIKN